MTLFTAQLFSLVLSALFVPGFTMKRLTETWLPEHGRKIWAAFLVVFLQATALFITVMLLYTMAIVLPWPAPSNLDYFGAVLTGTGIIGSICGFFLAFQGAMQKILRK